MNYHQIEFLAKEQQERYLTEADARHLARIATLHEPSLTQRIRTSIGAYLVQWGCALQGRTISLPLEMRKPWTIS